MFNTIIEIKRENKEGQLNIKINLYHDNEEELNKIVKAINKFKFYNDTTITNNDGSLSYTKATNVITINNIAEELLDFDNNIKELEKLFIEIGAEPLVLEGYLKATDKKEYKEEVKEEEKIEHMEKAGNDQNIEENTKNNNMKNVLNNLEMISRDNGENIDFVRIKDNKKNIEYSLFYFKATSHFSITIYKENKIISIDKDYNNNYIMNTTKEGEEKFRHYKRVGKDKIELFNTLFELYKLIKDTN